MPHSCLDLLSLLSSLSTACGRARQAPALSISCAYARRQTTSCHIHTPHRMRVSSGPDRITCDRDIQIPIPRDFHYLCLSTDFRLPSLMKRLSAEQRQRFERLRIRRLDYFRRKSRSKKKPELRSPAQTLSYIYINAPEYFLLYQKEAHDHLAIFLTRLREAIVNSVQPIKIDFSKTKKMVAGGTLLFFSELHRLQTAYPGRFPLLCVPPQDDTVGQVLEHLGLFKLIKCRTNFTPQRNDVVHWRCATGAIVDAATDAGPMLEETRGIPPELLPFMFRGISEAMTNVSHHAYVRPREDGLNVASDKRWWMFCREEANAVFVAFCDLGLGIPVTLEEREDRTVLHSILQSFGAALRGGRSQDAEMLKAAILLKKTRTKLPHQGKGLTDILRVVEEAQKGYISIYSNRGCYMKRYAGLETEVVRNYRCSIYGTLILWGLPLAAQEGIGP